MMTFSVVLLVASVFIRRSLEEICSGNLKPPLWRKTKSGDEDPAVLLGVDGGSGCTCRELPGRLAFCYGREICHSFPKNINFTSKAFQLKATQIVELKPGDLGRFTFLEALLIEGNYNLTRVRCGSFVNMTNLRNLSISYNANLATVEKGSFKGLLTLQHLSMVKNAFKLLDLTPALTDLPKLIKLELNENNFNSIKARDFEMLKDCSIQELALVLCRIEDIEVEAFNVFTNLTTLKLGENNFNSTTITRVLEEAVKHVPLKSLNLYSIGLRKTSLKPLLTAIANSTITDLCLARNQFEEINSNTFPSMPNLETLDLSEVLVLNITNDAFVRVPKLKSLILSGNKLASIPDGALLRHLQYLDLRQNSGHSYSLSYFSIHGQKFTNMKRLQCLDLSFNELHAVYNNSFTGLEELLVLGLKNATIYRIESGSFSMLPKLVMLYLENNPFMKTHPKSLEQGVLKGLDNLKVLQLGGCGISYLSKTTNPFRDLKSLVHLGLERNNFLTAPDFGSIPSLRTIDLSFNGLQAWHHSVFKNNKNLVEVSATNNKFQYLTSAMVQDFLNLSRLNLMNNPFMCDCSFSWNNAKILRLIENQSIHCAFPDTTTDLSINQFLDQLDNCRSLILIVPLVVLFLCLVVAIFVIYHFRWHLRYWIFLTRLYLSRNRKIRSSRNAYTNYIYDAFVSYSSDDRNFVIRLVTMLENYPPFIKLCVYERDFEIGTMISESVLDGVAKSRKTLLIISDSYAKSQWCRWESQIAEHHRIFFQNENGEYVDDSLILVKLGPVNNLHMTPTLKYLLKTRIYLAWDVDEKKQKVFWDKLRTILAPAPEMNENTYL